MLTKPHSTLCLLLLAALQLGLTMTTYAQSTDALTVEGVSRELARHRAARISDVRYRLSLELAPGAPRFKGHEEVRLKLADMAAPVIVDFRDLDQTGKVIEGTIRNVMVNSQPAGDVQQTGGHIVLPAHHFKAGENTI